MCNYFQIHLPVKVKKSFKGLSIFSAGSHYVKRKGTVCAILVALPPRNIPV